MSPLANAPILRPRRPDGRRTRNVALQSPLPLPSLIPKLVLPPPAPASAALWQALILSIASSKTCTIRSVSIPAPVAGEDNILVAPYPHATMSVLDLTAEYPDRPDTAREAKFNTWSKSKGQCWIRKLKRYVACLRSAQHVNEHSNPDRPPEADGENDNNSTSEADDDEMADAPDAEAMDQDPADAPAANADGQGIDAKVEENAAAAEASDLGMGVFD
jgi:hypothetical protein